MKPRKVFLAAELTTDVPLKALKDYAIRMLKNEPSVVVDQVQVNVVKPAKKK